ncbi:MAG: GGDEF domain-containing protein [Candidatus Sedimenticola endophacoides]
MLALVALLLLLPFAILNAVQEQVGQAVIDLLLIIGFGLNGWFHYVRRATPGVVFILMLPSMALGLTLAFGNSPAYGAFWSYPAAICAYFLMSVRWALVTNAAIYGLAVFLFSSHAEPALVVRFAATLLAVSLALVTGARMIEISFSDLNRLATTDPLTGLFNRTMFTELLSDAIKLKDRSNLDSTLLALDLDHFKKVNDRYGHSAGDGVLIALARVIKATLRSNDHVFRMGGEEFFILLSGTTREQAWHVAEKLRLNIRGMEVIPGHTVTASIGIAQLDAGETMDEWIGRADRHLYQAKTRGRDCTVVLTRVVLRDSE